MNYILASFLGLASGIAISGAVFALIAAIGVVVNDNGKKNRPFFGRLSVTRCC